MNLQRSHRLEDLVAARVVAFETTDHGDPSTLLPGDLAPDARRMGPNRAAEFAAGRACARRGLAELGFEPEPLPIGPGRAPHWPDGVRGSITHAAGFRGAMVARTADLGGAAVGIDAEAVGRVTTKLWERLFVGPERDVLADADDATELSTIFFSVKEAFYKAQYPLTEAWVGFGDVRVETSAPGELELHPHTDLAALNAVRWPVRARWHRDESLVLTGLVVQLTGNPASIQAVIPPSRS